VSAGKLAFILKSVIIISVVAAGGFGLSLLVSASRVNYQLAIQKLENDSNKAVKNNQAKGLGEASASAQAVTPASNLISAVPKSLQGTIIYQAKLKPNQKVIALTFDDGPEPKNTGKVLDILRQNHIKATFFMVGQMVQTYPQLAKKVVSDGHSVGNHTWHHWYRPMDATTAASEVNRTADIIYKTTGAKTALFRPPGGYLNNGLAAYAKNHQQAVMMWSVVSGDADRRQPQAPRLVKNVLKGAKPGAIVLMHDGGGNRTKTVKALPQIISGLKAQGYRFVTLPELLEIQAQEQQVATTKVKPTVKPTVTPAVINNEHPNPQPNN
jgi:peptidoglycan-N-acetylglucosamine deacetylase